MFRVLAYYKINHLIMFQLAIPVMVDGLSLSYCQHTCCDSQSLFSLALTYTHMPQQVYDIPMYVTVNMDHHQQLPPVHDSSSYRPSFANAMHYLTMRMW